MVERGRNEQCLCCWFPHRAVVTSFIPLAILFSGCAAGGSDGGGGGGEYVPTGLGGAGWTNSKGDGIRFGAPPGYPCAVSGRWDVSVYSLGDGTGTLDGRRLKFTLTDTGKSHVIDFIDETTLTLDGDASAAFTHGFTADFSTGSWAMAGSSATLELTSPDEGNAQGSLVGTEVSNENASISGSFDGTSVRLKIADSKGSHDWSGAFWGESEIRLEDTGARLTLRRTACPQ